MTSTITLYKDSKIIPSRNFIVESIEDYLTSLTKITITDFQYLRNDLNLSIKINKTQEFAESLATYNYNYLKVFQGSATYYYFITKKTQIAQSTIVLELVLDTLNTYKWGVDFHATNRTRVLREHKDRLKKIGPSKFKLSGEFYGGQFPAGGSESLEHVRIDLIDDDSNHVEGYGDILFRDLDLEDKEIKITNFEGLTQQDNEDLIDLSPIQIYYYDSGLEQYETIELNQAVSAEITDIAVKRLIDYYSEGLTPVLYKKELGNLIHKENSTWNLIYRTDQNDSDTIRCYCIPDEDINVMNITSGTLTYTNFVEGVHYIFLPFKIGNGYIKQTIVENTGKQATAKITSTGVGGITLNGYEILRTGTTLKRRGFKAGTSGANENILRLYEVYSWRTITSISFEMEKLYYKTSDTNPASNPISDWKTPTSNFSTSGTESESYTLADIDRVDPKLIKIISIPYFPTQYDYDAVNGTITAGDEWAYSSQNIKGLELNLLNTQFSSTITSEIDNPLNVFDISVSLNAYSGNRDNNNESKIFHSDYYRPKFVYDSFGFNFELEKINELVFSPSAKFTFDFVMTSTINSKFMFKFPEYILKMATEDYDNILPVARNNEAPIYNSAYITYLRTAYRYDLKNLNINNAQRIINYGVGTLEKAGSAVSSMIKEDYGGLAKTFLSLIPAASQTAFSATKERIALEAKLESLRNQATSVSGSDDLDLLTNYSGNRAKLCLYQVSDRMKNLLLDLFYYFGYTTEEIKIPETNTRYWFNFLSCELELTGLNSNITESAKTNLFERYREGATFLHKHSSTWDFEQVKENIENSLL